MHDMHMAGFLAGGRHYCLTGGNLREDPLKKTLVPARPRRPGPTIKKHAIRAEIRSACLRLAGSHARIAAGWWHGSRVRKHVPSRRHGLRKGRMGPRSGLTGGRAPEWAVGACQAQFMGWLLLA